jgi:hypothetical protein
MTSFILGDYPTPSEENLRIVEKLARTNRRPLRVVLLGARPDVIMTIHNLHRRRFAEAREWSRPMPCPSVTEMTRILANHRPTDQISILTKYFSDLG